MKKNVLFGLILFLLIAVSILPNCRNSSDKNNNKTDIESEEDKTDTKKITGKIIAAKDSTQISMAFITVPGTNIGTLSDGNGNFTIYIPVKVNIIIVGAKGFESKKVEVKENKELLIVLEKKENQ